MSDNAGELAKAAKRVAMIQTAKLLRSLDDEDADEALAVLLAKHWTANETTGNTRCLQWIYLGRAVEDIKRSLSQGNFGQGRTMLNSAVERQRLLKMIDLVYNVAVEHKAQEEEHQEEDDG
jgi:hypothetical protein